MFLTEQLLRNTTIWHYQLWKLACGINGLMIERLPNDEKRSNMMLITDTPHHSWAKQMSRLIAEAELDHLNGRRM